MKAFKKLASLCLGLTLCVGLCAFAACEKESTESSSSTPPVSSSVPSEEKEEATAYVFTVLDKDGNPLKDMAVLLCIPDLGCLPYEVTNEQGIVTYSVDANEYEVHVATKDDPNVYLEHEGITVTTTTYGEYTLKLKA